MQSSHRERKAIEKKELQELSFRPDSVVRTPFYFGTDEKPLMGWLHTPVSGVVRDQAVLVCPPLAVEYMSTYRALRYVCDYFANAGIPAMRLDYHGTGDSSGLNEDPDRLQDWLWSIEQAMTSLKKQTDCEHIGLFGLRFGATLAALVAERQTLDFMVLWAPLISGRKYIREVRAIQMTGSSQTGAASDEYIEAGGSVLWPETASQISTIDLLKLQPKAMRVLHIPRDDFKADEKLLNAWSEQGITVDQRLLPGYEAMLELAYFSIVPHRTLTQIVDWVTQSDTQSVEKQYESVTEQFSQHCRLKQYNGCNGESLAQADSVIESVLCFGDAEQNFAIVTEPEKGQQPDRPVILIVNSGANHRVGPSRLYVLLAREMARKGFCVLRLDIPGIGDSVLKNLPDENEEYITYASDVIHQAILTFEQRYQATKFIPLGLCSGAYFSFHAALDLQEHTILESILINPLTFYWAEGMEFDTDSPTRQFSYWNWYKQALRDPKSWAKLFRGKINYRALFNTIINRIKIVVSSKIRGLLPSSAGGDSNSPGNNLATDLKKIESMGRKLTFILARSDPGYDILMTSAGSTAKRLLKEQVIQIYFIEDADHTFSKHRPRCDAINAIVNHVSGQY